MPVTPIERGMLEQFFDQLLNEGSLDMAIMLVNELVDGGAIIEEEKVSFMVGFLSGIFFGFSQATLAHTEQKVAEIGLESVNIILRRIIELKNYVVKSSMK